MIWLSKEQAMSLHTQLINVTGGSDGVRDDGLLQSALMSPMQTFGSQELFPSVIEKAARLACGLTQFHPFIDGNKRIGVHAMLVVLELNGFSPTYTQKELSDIFLCLADGSADYDALVKFIKSHM